MWKLLLIVVLVLSGLWGWSRFRATTWEREVDRARAALLHGGPDHEAQGRNRSPALAELPEPVARYFRLVLPEAKRFIRTARVTQEGEFRTAPGEGGWKRFEAVEIFATWPRGFLWQATIDVAPFLPVTVVDFYREGQARMEGRILSTFAVVHQTHDPLLAEGALSRFLAEAVWIPTALLPGDGIVWLALDDSSARAQLSDVNVSVSADFHFNEFGEIIRVVVADRPRFVNGAYERCRWVGTFGTYEKRDGFLVPSEGEVAWELDSGTWSYWRGTILDIDYDFEAS